MRNFASFTPRTRLFAAAPFTSSPTRSTSLVSVRAMSTGTQPNGSGPPKATAQGGKKEVKILMIHGYTQSGAVFRAKTRALEKMVAKALAPISLLPTLIYPTGPNRLRPQDIPGYQPPADGGQGGEDGDQEYDWWAWWRKDEASGEYRFFDEGMATIADAIRDAGGVDGVLGFSQGGAVAGVVAAALESGRTPPEGPGGDWARKLREANDGRPLRFAVPYSGFYCPIDRLKWCYEPKIATPTLHVIGSLDTVVDETRTQGLVDRCQNPLVVTHPGGHYVPVARDWVMPLAGFIKQHAEEKPQAGL